MRKCDKVFGHNFMNVNNKDLLTPLVLATKANPLDDISVKKDMRHIKACDTYEEIFPDEEEVEYLVKKNKHRKWVKYLNIIITFDIEVTSFKFCERKAACMYCWQISVNDKVYIGRTRTEFLEMISFIIKKYNLNNSKRVIFWIHNLSYEFEFFRKWLTVSEVTSRKKHNVMRALMEDCLEWRCSYVLSAQSLSSVAKNLTEHVVRKTKEKMDYSLLRGTETELTEDEKRYCINDVIIVSCYIREQIKIYGDMLNIPMTNTGRVRSYCGEHIDDKSRKAAYNCKCTSKVEYKLWNQAFIGGFTHGNQFYAGKTLSILDDDNNVILIHCYDFTSSYPAVLVYEDKFAMSTGTRIELTEEILEASKNIKKCYIFRVRFTNLRQKPGKGFATPLSKSKCRNFQYAGYVAEGKKDEDYVVENNGKVIEFNGILETAMTDVDYWNYKKFYDWDEIQFGTSYEYYADYLPEGLVKCIIHFFKEKTYWKKRIKEMKKSGASSSEIAEATVTMMINKGMLNSTYGMCVQKLIESIISIEEGEWFEDVDDLNEVIDKYNSNSKRFLFFPWGIFCTAFARRNILNLIYGVGNDFIYADTDSVTYFDFEKHEEFFAKYNKWCWKKLTLAAEHFNLSQEELEYLLPADENHIKSAETLGMVDSDKFCYKFKHMGCKRYIYTDPAGNIHCTVAGVSKAGLEKMLRIARRNYQDPYEIFQEDMYVPPEFCNKQCLYYPNGDDEIAEGSFIDYQGNVNYFSESGFIYMEPTDYRLGVSEDYERILYGDYHDIDC